MIRANKIMEREDSSLVKLKMAYIAIVYSLQIQMLDSLLVGKDLCRNHIGTGWCNPPPPVDDIAGLSEVVDASLKSSDLVCRPDFLEAIKLDKLDLHVSAPWWVSTVVSYN
jgi:hypothetical protein